MTSVILSWCSTLALSRSPTEASPGRATGSTMLPPKFEPGASAEDTAKANDTAIAQAFSNGYLLGEILCKYNQIHPDVFAAAFRDSGRADDLIRNFTELQKVMGRLHIKFTPRQVNAMVNCAPGVAARVLYEVKTKLSVLSRVQVGRPKPGMHAMLANLGLTAPKPLFQAVTHAMFASTLRVVAGNQKDLNLTAALQSHNVEYLRLVAERETVAAARAAAHVDALRRAREVHLQALRDSHVAQRGAETAGVAQWALNQALRQGEERSRRFFLQRRDAARRSRAVSANVDGQRQFESGLAEFESIATVSAPLPTVSASETAAETVAALRSRMSTVRDSASLRSRRRAAVLSHSTLTTAAELGAGRAAALGGYAMDCSTLEVGLLLQLRTTLREERRITLTATVSTAVAAATVARNVALEASRQRALYDTMRQRFVVATGGATLDWQRARNVRRATVAEVDRVNVETIVKRSLALALAVSAQRELRRCDRDAGVVPLSTLADLNALFVAGATVSLPATGVGFMAEEDVETVAATLTTSTAGGGLELLGAVPAAGVKSAQRPSSSASSSEGIQRLLDAAALGGYATSTGPWAAPDIASAGVSPVSLLAAESAAVSWLQVQVGRGRLGLLAALPNLNLEAAELEEAASAKGKPKATAGGPTPAVKQSQALSGVRPSSSVSNTSGSASGGGPPASPREQMSSPSLPPTARSWWPINSAGSASGVSPRAAASLEASALDSLMRFTPVFTHRGRLV